MVIFCGNIIERQKAPIEIDNLTAFQHVIERGVVAFFTFAQGVLRLFAFGDIGHNGEAHWVAVYIYNVD